MKYLFLLSLVVACSSGPTQLSKKARNIEVVNNKPVGCSTVGKLVGNDSTGSREVALNDVLNQAADLDATVVHVNQEVPNGRHIAVHATAYQCE